MNRTLAVGVAAALWMSTTGVDTFQAARQGAQAEPRPTAGTADRVLLDHYCVTCHNARWKTGGLALDTADPSDVSRNIELWEKVIRKVRAGMMPPPGRPASSTPSDEERRALVASLEGSLDRVA